MPSNVISTELKLMIGNCSVTRKNCRRKSSNKTHQGMAKEYCRREQLLFPTAAGFAAERHIIDRRSELIY